MYILFENFRNFEVIQKCLKTIYEDDTNMNKHDVRKTYPVTNLTQSYIVCQTSCRLKGAVYFDSLAYIAFKCSPTCIEYLSNIFQIVILVTDG